MERERYTIVQLAVGAYDVLRDEDPIAALVQVSPGRWWIELLDESNVPPPFARSRHEFRSREEAIEWLGSPAIVRLGRSFREALASRASKGIARRARSHSR